MQMAGPLFNMGTFFREVDQSKVDVEDLYHMLKQQPVVNEKDDAKQFEFKAGGIEFENLGFKHYVMNEEEKDINSKLLF
jgi:ABC-type transport system involved in Fe-S cluster assembly fused permease/ATPase subunit